VALQSSQQHILFADDSVPRQEIGPRPQHAVFACHPSSLGWLVTGHAIHHGMRP
jgi:hypothetical protein